MKLAARLIAVTLASVVVLTLASGYFLVRNVQWEFEVQQRESAERIAKALTVLIVDQWRSEGEAGVASVLRSGGPASSLGFDLSWVSQDKISPWQRPYVGGKQLSSTSTILLSNFGKQELHTFVPLAIDGQVVGGIEFAGSLDPLERQTQRIIWISLASIGAFSLASILAAYVAGIRWIGEPLQALSEKAERIGRGDFSGPLQLKQRDELGSLARSFNSMCQQLSQHRENLEKETSARLTAVDQLRHADRLKTVGVLAAGVAHEIGTPLGVIAGRATLINSDRLTQEQVKESAVAIKQEADRIAEIVRQLLAFARVRTPKLVRDDLLMVIRSTAELIESFAQGKHVEIQLKFPEQPIYIFMDGSQLQQVLTNLLMNAIQAMPNGGVVTISAKLDEFAEVTVSDSGVGIPPESLNQIFDPFFTTKEVGEGTGLGLSIVQGIIQEHGGTIEVTSELGKGTSFRILLPRQLAQNETNSQSSRLSDNTL
ncbi:MAG: ATP-binding protein [Pirellulales bacterium]